MNVKNLNIYKFYKIQATVQSITSSFQTPIKIEYMVCNDKQCLPPKTIDIMLVVPAKK